MDPDVVAALVRLIEYKDRSTAAHTWRVVLYTRALAEHMGMEPSVIDRLGTAAALHDIGKLDIPDQILQKPTGLTEEEYAVMQQHAALGHARLIAMRETDPILLNLVRHHHERYDGTGYPDGLAAQGIPAEARWFTVIDSFDAMTSLRPYHTEVGRDAAGRAIAELRGLAGVRYDPDAVREFAGLFERGELDWILSHFNQERVAQAEAGRAALDPGGAVVTGVSHRDVLRAPVGQVRTKVARAKPE